MIHEFGALMFVPFTCNGNPVEQVATFKYLGLAFGRLQNMLS